MLEMILNELSLQPAGDRYAARQWMNTFVQTIKAAVSQGITRSLRTQRIFYDTVLAIDYPLRRWLNDDDVDRESRRYILRLSTKAPFWDGLQDLYDTVEVITRLL